MAVWSVLHFTHTHIPPYSKDITALFVLQLLLQLLGAQCVWQPGNTISEGAGALLWELVALVAAARPAPGQSLGRGAH